MIQLKPPGVWSTYKFQIDDSVMEVQNLVQFEDVKNNIIMVFSRQLNWQAFF